MDAATASKWAPKEELGSDILKSPQDLALCGTHELIAIADDYNGVVVLNNVGKLVHHLPELKDAHSLCYRPTSKQLVVCVLKTMNGKPNPHLVFCDVQDSFKKLHEVAYPKEPFVNGEYPRYVTCCQQSEALFICTGDNNNAIIQRYDPENDQWLLVYQFYGICQKAACFHDGSNSILVCAWDLKDEWTVKKITMDSQTHQAIDVTTVVSREQNKFVSEPSTVYVDRDNRVYIYCAATGYVWLMDTTNADEYYAATAISVIAMGQSVGIETDGNDFYETCSSERLLKRYLLYKKNLLNTVV